MRHFENYDMILFRAELMIVGCKPKKANRDAEVIKANLFLTAYGRVHYNHA